MIVRRHAEFGGAGTFIKASKQNTTEAFSWVVKQSWYNNGKDSINLVEGAHLVFDLSEDIAQVMIFFSWMVS